MQNYSNDPCLPCPSNSLHHFTLPFLALRNLRISVDSAQPQNFENGNVVNAAFFHPFEGVLTKDYVVAVGCCFSYPSLRHSRCETVRSNGPILQIVISPIPINMIDGNMRSRGKGKVNFDAMFRYWLSPLTCGQPVVIPPHNRPSSAHSPFGSRPLSPPYHDGWHKRWGATACRQGVQGCWSRSH